MATTAMATKQLTPQQAMHLQLYMDRWPRPEDECCADAAVRRMEALQKERDYAMFLLEEERNENKGLMKEMERLRRENEVLRTMD